MQIFQSFWHGESLANYANICMKSFLHFGHQFHLYTYDEIEVPSGVILCDADDILPREDVFFYKKEDGSKGSVAAFSNLFRYELLKKKGNWWVDTDVLCLSNKVPMANSFFGWEDNRHVNGAILKIPSESALLEALIKNARDAGKDVYWGQIGPRLLTRLIVELGLSHQVSPSSFAYPLHWDDYRDLLEPERRSDVYERLKDAPFLHLWNEKFRLDGNLSLDNPVDGSFWGDVSKVYSSVDVQKLSRWRLDLPVECPSGDEVPSLESELEQHIWLRTRILQSEIARLGRDIFLGEVAITSLKSANAKLEFQRHENLLNLDELKARLVLESDLRKREDVASQALLSQIQKRFEEEVELMRSRVIASEVEQAAANLKARTFQQRYSRLLHYLKDKLEPELRSKGNALRQTEHSLNLCERKCAELRDELLKNSDKASSKEQTTIQIIDAQERELQTLRGKLNHPFLRILGFPKN